MTSNAAVAAAPLQNTPKRKQRSITSIERADRRAELAPRRQPHWKMVKSGSFIGYRFMTRGRPGSWLARTWLDSERKYAQCSLGDFADKPEGERYDAAVAKAAPFFAHHAAGGSTEAITVRQAGEAYVERKRTEEGAKAAGYAEAHIRRAIYEDQIAGVLLPKLTESQCMAWRARLLERAGGVEHTSSFNRSLVAPRAALNLAHEDRKVTTRPWLRALKQLENRHSAGKRRTLTLDRDERQQLVDACSEDVRPMVAALAMLPMRPGEMAALRVNMLNVRERVLEIPQAKTEPRIIPLGSSMLAFFQQQAAGKQPDDWLFSRADGTQWDANGWGRPIRRAVKAAGLPTAACLYTLRHSLITSLIVGGCDLMTVSKVAGTSLQMIQASYGHLVAEHARDHLERLAFAAPKNVIPLTVAA